jgi:predicted NAD/FAD-binding protein
MASLTRRAPRKKVAIIGSGSAGIGALWALNRTHHDVYMYEAADRLGGHTNTVDFQVGKYKTAVDTGFIVLNTATYRSSSSCLLSRAKLTRRSQFHSVSKVNEGTHYGYGNDLWSIP